MFGTPLRCCAGLGIGAAPAALSSAVRTDDRLDELLESSPSLFVWCRRLFGGYRGYLGSLEGGDRFGPRVRVSLLPMYIRSLWSVLVEKY